MENEIKFIKENIEKLYPKEAIRDLFQKKYICTLKVFEECWEQAHEVPEFAEEPKKEDKGYGEFKKKILVNCCINCPNKEFFEQLVKGKRECIWYCGENEKVIDETAELPTWCPLEDNN